MKIVTSAVARHLDRLARMQRLRQLAPLVGMVLVGAGIGALSMTWPKAPGSLSGLAPFHPHITLTILPWLPAPPHFRLIGMFLLLLGVVTLTLASVLKRRDT